MRLRSCINNFLIYFYLTTALVKDLRSVDKDLKGLKEAVDTVRKIEQSAY
jgi:hypothetical protein